VIKSGAPVWADPARELPGLPPTYLLTIASQAPHKRVADVVRGWAAASARSSSVPPLVVLGGLSEQQRAGCRHAGGSRAADLHVLGPVTDRGRMRWAYERASALVSMSVLEAFPLTPVEAGSLGCPLVLSDIPAHREVTLGNAVFVRPGEVEELAAALCDGAGGAPGSRRWDWPISWADNARDLRSLFDEVRR
jgi:glycosyltransferase involved in cell wall biosynthesis